MYQDLVDEACGDSKADICIVVGVCKLTKQWNRNAGTVISMSETFCHYRGCMRPWEAISAVEAAFMSADDR